MTRAWILRSLQAPGYEDLAFAHDLVGVGWGIAGDLSAATNHAQVRDAVRAAYPFVERSTVETYSEQLYSFRAEIERDDIVVLLRRSTPAVAVGRIVGDYRYAELTDPNVRHVRAVHWERTEIPRVLLEQELLLLPPLQMVHLLSDPMIVASIARLAAAYDSTTSANETAISVEIPEDSRPFANLQRNLNYARSLATAGQHLQNLDVRAFEVPDVFRAAWVQAVAALDHWVRQELRARMLQLTRLQSGEKPKGYTAFSIPMGDIEKVLKSEVALIDVVDAHLGQTRGHLAYQHPDKIRDALVLVSDVRDLWNQVANVLNQRTGDGSLVTGANVRQLLIDIVRRRNKIAHESDEDLGPPPAKQVIDAPAVTATIDWIEELAAAILIVLDNN